MRSPWIVAILLWVTGCSTVTAVFAEKPPDPLPLPTATPTLDITMKVFVIGDAGEKNFTHDAAFAAMQQLVSRNSVPSVLLVPGDVTYPKGLPDTCTEAQERLTTDYFKQLGTGIPIYIVPGNHDHQDRDFGTKNDVAWRDAYFDCEQQSTVAALVGWPLRQCQCNRQWHVPTGAAYMGARTLVPAGASRMGFTLLAYDSQAAIENPDQVASDLERALDSAAPTQRLIVMAHHPIASYGPHGRSSKTAQDLQNAKYKAYIDRFAITFATRRDRIALLVFGHDHTVQYIPREPPILISGAGAKKESVSKPADGAIALGETPGLAMLELHATGAITVHLISKQDPQRIEIAPK